MTGDYPIQTEAVASRMEITLANGKVVNAVIIRDDAETPFLTIARSDKRYFIIGNLLRNELCNECDGSGVADISKHISVSCAVCGGSGNVIVALREVAEFRRAE